MFLVLAPLVSDWEAIMLTSQLSLGTKVAAASCLPTSGGVFVDVVAMALAQCPPPLSLIHCTCLQITILLKWKSVTFM